MSAAWLAVEILSAGVRGGEGGGGGHLGSHEVRTGVKGGNTFLPHPDTTLEKRGGNIGRRELETFGQVEY